MSEKKAAPCEQEAVIRKRSIRAKVIQVIVVDTVVGNGSQESPYTSIKEYWSLDGQLLATSAP